jgi:hypothetical protein
MVPGFAAGAVFFSATAIVTWPRVRGLVPKVLDRRTRARSPPTLVWITLRIE